VSAARQVGFEFGQHPPQPDVIAGFVAGTVATLAIVLMVDAAVFAWKRWVR
jgi:hypothetical protein